MAEPTCRLHQAICDCDAEAVKVALADGADVRAFRDDGYSPLSFIDDPAILKLLLDAGADPNHAVEGEACDILFWAASAGRLEIINMLVAAGATVEAELVDYGKNLYEWESSVHVAVEKGEIEIVRCLLGAEGKQVLNCFYYVCRTPLIIAVDRGDKPMVQLLLQAGADVNAHDEPRAGDTALNRAVKEQSIELVKLLLKSGADPKIPAFSGTALDAARGRRDKIGPQIASLLEAL